LFRASHISYLHPYLLLPALDSFPTRRSSDLRLEMKEAGLTPPIFESNRAKDMFTAQFLFHHFLSEDDVQWLARFKDLQLTDQERSEEHTSELQSRFDLVCRLLLEKKKTK